MQRLILVAIGLRVVATLVLVLGPWTDSPAELDGWDVERFQQISEIDGRAWVDEDVEYPPGSVVLIETVARSGVVGTHRVLALASLAVDLAVAFAVGALGGRRAAAAYLILGLPLVPMGLLRFDLWAALAAVLATAALRQRKPAAFALLATAGALIKVWPALIVAAALALGRYRSVVVTIAAMGAAGLVWLAWTGWSLDAVEQVLSMRGATGWHAESVIGSIEALRTGAEPTLEQNAFRIGTLDQRLVLGGRVVAVGVIAAAIGLGLRRHRSEGVETEIVALVMTAAVGALILTSPLLSPQFLLWLTPWLALAPRRAPGDDNGPTADWPALWWLGFAATATTGLVLTVYGPPRVAESTPALALLARDGLVLAAVAVALAGLASTSGRAEGSLRQSSATPGQGRTDPQVDEVADEAGPLGH